MVGGVDGLASGINTTELVDSLIDVQRGAVRIKEDKRDLAKSRLELVQQYNVKLLSAQLDLVGLKRPATFDTRSATSSNTAVGTVAAARNVAAGSYTFDVLQIAGSEQVSTAGFASRDADIGTGTLTLQVGDAPVTDISIDAGNGTLDGLVDAINASDAGVRAQILNDGSAEPFRLLLTAEATGAGNDIRLDTSGLSGTGSESLQQARGSDGLSAELSGRYRGSDLPDVVDIRVKDIAGGSDADQATYEIRVGSDGSYVDLDEAFIDRSVSGGATVDLGAALGGSSGGLIATLSGTGLTAGSSAASFRPLQELRLAQDAQVRFGTDDSGFVLSRSDNLFEDLVPGMDLQLGTETGMTTIDVGVDADGIIGKVTTFVESFNDAMGFLREHTAYDTETQEAGLLQSVNGLRGDADRMIRSLTDSVENEGSFSLLSQLGITLGDDGLLKIDKAVLSDAVNNQLEDVRGFFVDTGVSDNPGISFAALGSYEPGGVPLSVELTQAAEQATLGGFSSLQATTLIDSDSDSLALSVNGRAVVLTLAEKDGGYNHSELVAHLQDLADAHPDLANNGITFGTNGAGALTVTTDRYGSLQNVMVTGGDAADDLGLSVGSSASGVDAIARVGDEIITGQGQAIQAGSDSAFSGLSLVATLSPEALIAGNGNAEIVLNQGLARRIDGLIERATDARNGSVTRTEQLLISETQGLNEQIDRADALLEVRRQRFMAEFRAMEEVLAGFQAQEQFLAGQLEAFSNMAAGSARRG